MAQDRKKGVYKIGRDEYMVFKISPTAKKNESAGRDE